MRKYFTIAVVSVGRAAGHVAAIVAAGATLTIVYLLKSNDRVGRKARLLFLIQEEGLWSDTALAWSSHWRVTA
jgi:hypothetical protein